MICCTCARSICESEAERERERSEVGVPARVPARGARRGGYACPGARGGGSRVLADGG